MPLFFYLRVLGSTVRPRVWTAGGMASTTAMTGSTEDEQFAIAG